MPAEIEKAFVRFFEGDSDTVVGAGFLVPNGQLLTCAHVVDRALKRHENARRRPKHAVKVDFPLVQPNAKYSAYVTRWIPPNEGDVATLQLSADPPGGAKVARVAPLPPEVWDREIGAFGCPAGFEYGTWSRGRLRGPQSHGWIEVVEDGPNAQFIQVGFSGAPVWDRQSERVIGMIVAVRRGGAAQSAFMIPSTKLGRRLAFTARRGDIAWQLNHLRSSTIGSLLDDLSAAEDAGFGEECPKLKKALAWLVNSAADIPENSFWKGTIHKDLEEFEALYEEWNGHHRESGREQRKLTLRKMRDTRQRIAQKVNAFQSVLSTEMDRNLFRAVFNEFGNLCTQHPATFSRLNDSVRIFFKRCDGRVKVTV